MLENKEEQNFEIFKLDYVHQHEKLKVMFDSTLEAGSAALKSAFIMNGGAALALLALIGNLAKDDKAEVLPNFFHNSAFAILLFSCGVLAAALATGIKYFTQYVYTRATAKRLTPGLHLTQEQIDDWKKTLKEVTNSKDTELN